MKTLRAFSLLLFICLIFSLFWGCQPRRVYIKTPISPSEREKFNNAQNLIQQGEIDKALKLFQDFVEAYPSSTLCDDALLSIGKIYLERKRYKEASEKFKIVIYKFPEENSFFKAKYYLALSYYHLNQYYKAEKILIDICQHIPVSENKAAIFSLMGDVKNKLGKRVEAVIWYEKVWKVEKRIDVKDGIKTRVSLIINRVLKKKELEEILNKYPNFFLINDVKLRLVSYYLNEGKKKKADKLLLELQQATGKTLSPEEVKRLKRSLPTPAQPLVGVLLPLSGKGRGYGERCLKGILLGMKIFNYEHNDLKVKLLIEDTSTDPEEAKNAVLRLALNNNVIAIIGPLFKRESKSAATIAQEKKIPIITLTPLEEIYKIGDFVFRNSLTARLEISTISQYIIKDLNIVTAAVIYPNNTFGIKMKNIFWDEFTKRGGEIVEEERYKETETDFQSHIRRIAHLGSYTPRTGRSGVKRRYPIVHFQAIFIPDEPEKGAMIASQLEYFDIIGVLLLGTHLWDTPRFIKTGDKYVNGAIFADGFFKNSNSLYVSDFVKEFINTFGQEPSILEAQAYDAARIIYLILSQQKAIDRETLKDALFSIKDFPGVSGLRGFTEEGENIKQLYILKVENGEIVEVK